MDDSNDSNLEVNHYMRLKDRKEALELKISEKYFELKKLCISEAELTGIIPLEIPLDPDESPPKIKRRIGTMFPYTDEVINQLQINQFPSLPTIYKSPKRKTPFTPWNTRCDILPPLSPVSLSVKSKTSPASGQVGTWPAAMKSPQKQQNRHRLCRTKLNSLFKKW